MMSKLSQLVQSGDWKGEKHVPVITSPDTVNAGEQFDVRVCVGEEVKHPNTLEHHISWVKVFFKPEGTNFPVEIGNFNFTAHGEGAILDDPTVVNKVSVEKSGTLYALSYCNIHGLWESSKEITVK